MVDGRPMGTGKFSHKPTSFPPSDQATGPSEGTRPLTNVRRAFCKAGSGSRHPAKHRFKTYLYVRYRCDCANPYQHKPETKCSRQMPKSNSISGLAVFRICRSPSRMQETAFSHSSLAVRSRNLLLVDMENKRERERYTT